MKAETDNDSLASQFSQDAYQTFFQNGENLKVRKYEDDVDPGKQQMIYALAQSSNRIICAHDE